MHQASEPAEPSVPAESSGRSEPPRRAPGGARAGGRPAGGLDLERTATADVPLGQLSLTSRLVIAGAVGTLGVYAVYHLLLVFLFVAPANTVSQEYGEGMREYIYPEFEQTWKLFAPNPLQRNVAIEVRAEVRDEDGGRTTTDWISLTAMDLEGIVHNPMPSHTAQNTLRRAWDFYSGSHSTETGEPIGLRGELAEVYLRRIALLRLEHETPMDMDRVDRIQMRSATSLLPAPEWSSEEINTTTGYYELDWWVVTTEDLPSGELASGTSEGE
ncbi:DUF5819 family protein [Streptomyces sp. B6B3]|uniref:DUF5819 family protein n=1 Tax=Streptomyces sp. B6B3 TaxID=3153570 RepID=UPI00325E45CB